MKRSMLCLVWMFCFKTNSSLWVFFKSLNLEECWEERCQVWYLQQETCLQTSERRRRTPAHIVSGIIQRSGAASLTASRRRHWVQWAYFTLSPQLTGFLTSRFPSWCVRKSFYLSWFEFFDNKSWRSSPSKEFWNVWSSSDKNNKRGSLFPLMEIVLSQYFGADIQSHSVT